MCACAHQPSLSYQSGFLNGSQLPFTAHTDPAYLALILPVMATQRLQTQIEEHLQRPLLSRHEAHVTVITPPEFQKGLSAFIRIDEINEMAKQSQLQQTALRPICVGRGELVIDGHPEQTYFIVVEASALLTFRRQVQQLLIKRGGSAELFTPERFWPHVTIAFTKRDLFEQDGIVKDRQSCVYAL
jgi:2'-5' RNA ligase